MTATFHVGDAIEVMGKLPENSVDLVLTSPPFLALRSYLPADHPDKALEGGSQATPGAFIDWLVDVVEACDRVLAPHGSMCIELGDTYAGNDGGGDAALSYRMAINGERDKGGQSPTRGRTGWPLAKSLSLIPELFRLTLVYGTNPLTGRQTERWRLRNVVRWVRPNPPVGALGDKFRPATSELMVFCKSAKRYFDLDAVREPLKPGSEKPRSYAEGAKTDEEHGRAKVHNTNGQMSNPAGAPPLDWWKIPDSAVERVLWCEQHKQPYIDFGICNLIELDGYPCRFVERLLVPISAGSLDAAPPLDWWNIPPGGYVTLPEPVNPGEYVGDILYIESEGCPLHEGQLDLAATAQHGEPLDIPSSHSSDTDGRPASVRRAGSVPTVQQAAPTLWDGSSDSPNPEPPPVAKRRSKASNRTAPAPATKPPDTASDRTPDRTDDTSSGPLSDVPRPDTPENRTSAAVYQVDPALESYARTGHKPPELEACTCSFFLANADATRHYAVKPGKKDRSKERWAGQVPHDKATGRDGGTGAQNPNGAPPLDWWEIPPGGYQGSHYAVMPPELCVKPIKAMCPERVCRVCGEPSRRIVEGNRHLVTPGINTVGQMARVGAGGAYATEGRTEYTTLGFSECGHNDWRPGVVLDPFVGSGTTLMVATGHGRDAIGIDLDSRNFDLALERVGPFILERAL